MPGTGRTLRANILGVRVQVCSQQGPTLSEYDHEGSEIEEHWLGYSEAVQAPCTRLCRPLEYQRSLD
jgi:hypothetical protein